MEFKIIKWCSRITFLLILILTLNHAARGLQWFPISLLLIPAYGMLVFGEGLKDD
jgi:hypothetical protein